MLGTIEERVAYLEGKTEEHSKAWVDIKDMIIHLEGRINAFDAKIDRHREELSGRIDALDQKFSGRIDSINGRIDALDAKIDRHREELSLNIRTLDQKFTKYFLWMIGIQVSIFLAIIATLLR